MNLARLFLYGAVGFGIAAVVIFVVALIFFPRISKALNAAEKDGRR